jgi:hypothetical protein
MNQRATIPGPHYTLFVCPCGYHRDVTRNERWERQPIDHPLYGVIGNMALARMDIASHNCDLYLERKRSLEYARRARLAAE